MQEPKHNSAPYIHLGNRLKYVREQKSETLAEAAGAVEIDLEELERIESGNKRPSEDILMLLINHFDIQDQDAVKLWEAAGYEQTDNRARVLHDQIDKNATMIVLALDMRTQYTDSIDARATDTGVVLNFGQSNGASTQPVARLGMSRQQAEVVLKTLQTALLKAQYVDGPRLLPPGNSY